MKTEEGISELIWSNPLVLKKKAQRGNTWAPITCTGGVGVQTQERSLWAAGKAQAQVKDRNDMRRDRLQLFTPAFPTTQAEQQGQAGTFSCGGRKAASSVPKHWSNVDIKHLSAPILPVVFSAYFPLEENPNLNQRGLRISYMGI